MTLPKPGQSYSQSDEANARSQIDTMDGQNIKKTAILSKLVFRDTVTGAVKTLTIASGAVVIT